MSNIDTRQLSRDSLFVMAKVTVEDEANGTEHPVKVRNLSSGGLMAEGSVKVARGSMVKVELRNIGWIGGTVAWKQDNRFGVAFLEDIDAKAVRKPPPPSSELNTASFVRPGPRTGIPEPSKLRKI